MPRDHNTREPRGFAFVEVLMHLESLRSDDNFLMQFLDERDAKDAQDAMDRQMLEGREVRSTKPRMSCQPGGCIAVATKVESSLGTACC